MKDTNSIAVISDIHSNSYALEAVLRHIDARGIKTIVNLGDSLFGPINPLQTAQLLIDRSDMIHIMGNCDRYLLQDQMESATFQYVKSLLTPQIEHWLRSFKKTYIFEDILFCHGTPFADDVYLLEEVTPFGVIEKSSSALTSELAPITQSLIFCGHTHLQKSVWLPDGKWIVNPGSVGLPAYYEDIPYPHAMESMTPHAKYLTVSRHEHSWRIEHISLPYDYEQAAHIAAQHGRHDYSHAIQHGKALVS
ncbi:metallophosphoesterase family protein [Paenibacillus sp. 481]|uniref:metallophosphoesterase family protein n=1 Tax=Paenibacillus sp. 481 TaxID=2835869 RepID=UPI003FA70A97